MLKQTVIFSNIDGQQVSKDLFFNITKTELSEQELLSGGQFSRDLQRLKDIGDMSEAYPIIQNVIGVGYGVRTPEGDFVKPPGSWETFKTSLAYNQLMDDILFSDPVNNGKRLAEFVNAMLPEYIRKQVAEEQARAAQDGFRPGADTSRPTPPVAGEQSQPVSQGVAPAAEQPAVGYSEPQPVQQPYQQPQAPQVQGGFYQVPTEAEAGITRQSIPREDPQLNQQ